ncbi:hypothetical protein AOLI_G00262400 [Acnodon oligacanthus]
MHDRRGVRGRNSSLSSEEFAPSESSGLNIVRQKRRLTLRALDCPCAEREVHRWPSGGEKQSHSYKHPKEGDRDRFIDWDSRSNYHGH